MLSEVTPYGVGEEIKTQRQGRDLATEYSHRPGTTTKTLAPWKIVHLVAARGGRLRFQWKQVGVVD